MTCPDPLPFIRGGLGQFIRGLDGRETMSTSEVKERAQRAFVRSRIRLLQQKPFWASLVLKMPLEWLENVPGGVSCTDGERMYINPDVYATFTHEEQVSVLVHEAWHCAAGHILRAGKSRDAQKWNLAADVYIANAMDSEQFTLIKLQEDFFGQIELQRAEYSEMITEQIYDALPDMPQNGLGGQGKDGKSSQNARNDPSSGHQHWNGGGCYKPTPSGAKERELREKWRRAVIEAGQLAGDLPGACQELVKAAMPKPPFHLALWEHLQRGMGGELTWNQVNRRYVHAGQYFPQDVVEIMGRVAWICDTSGSMRQDELKLAFGYFRHFRAEHPCQADLICCDYGVASHKTYEDYEELPETFTASGRGGTSFDAPFKLLRERNIEPVVAVYVTDGFGTCTAPKPPYPALWVVVGSNREFKPPFGEVVYAAQHD
jgi:predicted metal-dependent peptidase